MSPVSPAPAPTPTVPPAIRPVEPDDEPSIIELFFGSMVLGRPASIGGGSPAMDAYAAMCLDWYLDEGRADAFVATIDGRIVGYALVCNDVERHDAWARRRVVGLAGTVASATARARLSAAERRFFRLRCRDAIALVRSGRHVEASAHAHLNIDARYRTAALARRVRDEIDVRVANAGHGSWCGEINAPVGRRSRSLVRAGFEVVGREPNATLSWLAGTPIERLTVQRTLDPP